MEATLETVVEVSNTVERSHSLKRHTLAMMSRNGIAVLLSCASVTLLALACGTSEQAADTSGPKANQGTGLDAAQRAQLAECTKSISAITDSDGGARMLFLAEVCGAPLGFDAILNTVDQDRRPVLVAAR